MLVGELTNGSFFWEYAASRFGIVTQILIFSVLHFGGGDVGPITPVEGFVNRPVGEVNPRWVQHRK